MGVLALCFVWGLSSVLAGEATAIWTSTVRPSDNKGREFVVMFLENYNPDQQVFPLELYISTQETRDVHVHVTSPKWYNSRVDKQVIVRQGHVENITIDASFRMTGNAMSTKAILIKADGDVACYGVNKESLSNDGYLALPTDALGTDYYAMTHSPASLRSEIGIASTADSTHVKLTLPSNNGNLDVTFKGQTYHQGDTINVGNMNKYETLQIKSKGDLTGTHIETNQPVAAFSGNKKTTIGGGNYSDHLVEMLVPSDRWGKQFITAPIPGRTVGDVFKVVAREDNTIITIPGQMTGTINKGDSHVFELHSDSYNLITASKPIMLAQFSKSAQSETDNVADPSMILVTPIEQFGSDYTFTTPESSHPEKGLAFHYTNDLIIVIKRSEVDGLQLDGLPFPRLTWHDIPGTDMVGGFTTLPRGTHTVHHVNPLATYGGYLYGHSHHESYGFPLGMRTAVIYNPNCTMTLSVPGDGIDNDCDNRIDEELCSADNHLKDDDGDGFVDEDCAKPTPVGGEVCTVSEWSQCSQTCGGGTRRRTRICTPASGHSSSVREQGVCNSQDCPVDGGWGSWLAWNPCSQTCGGGSTSRARICNYPLPAYGGKDCPGSAQELGVCNSQGCSADGGWGSWLPWSQCIQTCGLGSRPRTRVCDSPAPSNGGINCSGASLELGVCRNRDCPVDGGWSTWLPWGPCSPTCGNGSRSRARACDNPTPAHGGASCNGSTRDNELCYGQNCSAFTPAHGGASYNGSTQENELCYSQDCSVDGGWGSWLPWNQCSQTCGGGSMSRARSCDNPTPAGGGNGCHGDSRENDTCNNQVCPGWSAWFYSPCSVTCGTGTKTAMRSCGSGHVEDCTGPSQKTETCTEAHCQVDGGWGTWLAWGTCTQTCDGGSMSRARICNYPLPAYGGNNCTGDSRENNTCNSQACSVDGDWGSWLPWHQCSKTCGGGSRSRARSCDSPTPAGGGNGCHGDSRENDTCNNNGCPGWSAWFYGPCSVTCGTGTKQAMRTCSSGHVEDCTGPASKTENCTQAPCPVDGGWGSWSPWSQCSKTCGGGTLSRARSCDNPQPDGGGHNCSGDSQENGACNNQACPDWSAWFYSPCSVTCGTGNKQAVRSCSSGHTEDCAGHSTKSEICTQAPCPAIDGGWGIWQAWSACSITCGTGPIRRQRACDNPSPQYGGLNCSGNATETKQCHIMPACPSWSGWFSGPCTATCGTGTRHSMRVCSSGHVEDCPGSSTQSEPCTSAPCPAVSEMCYNCKAIPYPRDCDQVVRCSPDSRCFTDEYVTASGTVLYNTGCRSISRCEHTRRDIIGGGDVGIFKMDANDVIEVGHDVGMINVDADDDTVLCEECCVGDFCNIDGCNTKPMLPAGSRGPVCFNCHQQSKEDSCYSVTLCDIHERCQLTSHVTNNNDTLYTTGCSLAAVRTLCE